MEVNHEAQWLELLLDLKRKPVGIKFLLTKEDYRNFDAEVSANKMSYCTVVKKASQGKCLKIHNGHSACMGGAMALGFEKPSADVISGRRRLLQESYSDLGVCRHVSKHMEYCQHDAYGVAVMPLEMFSEPPDVVIIICNPFQSMRISQGYAYFNGHVNQIKLSGMQAICQECTSYPYEKRCLNFSFLCSGTRMLGGWEKEDMAAGFPGGMLEQLIKGIRNTVNPLERNQEKKRILKELESRGWEHQLYIRWNQNYDDGAYHGGLALEP